MSDTRPEAADVIRAAILETARGSARQIEDVRALLGINAGHVDVAYVERWLDDLRVRSEWNMVSQRGDS